MTYLAYLCYPIHDELLEETVVIQFEQPPSWKYAKVVPIQFSVLHSWADADKELYK